MIFEFRIRVLLAYVCAFISANANTLNSVQWISTNTQCIGLVCIASCLSGVVVQLCNAFVNFVFQRISVPRILNKFLDSDEIIGKWKAMHCTQIEKEWVFVCLCERKECRFSFYIDRCSFVSPLYFPWSFSIEKCHFTDCWMVALETSRAILWHHLNLSNDCV